MRELNRVDCSYRSVTGSKPIELSARATMAGILDWAAPMEGVIRLDDAGVSNWVYAVAVPA